MRKILIRSELRAAILIAAALFIAQMGAIAHAYSHDAVRSAATRHMAAHELCDDCSAYAPLLAAAGPAVSLPIAHSRDRMLAARAAVSSVVDRSVTLAFRSRAPPATP